MHSRLRFLRTAHPSVRASACSLNRVTALLATVLMMPCLAPAAEADPEPRPAGPQPLHVGWAMADITPPRPVALTGQLHKRISKGVRDPLTVTVLALESGGQNTPAEQAILVSCDLLIIQRVVQQRLQEMLRTRLPGFDTRKLVLNATHTHTGPGFVDSTFGDLYDVSNDEGVMKASEYADFFLERVAEAAVRAWQGRKPGSLGWALTHAVIGYNRRAHFFNGTSVMYGNTDSEDFSHVEGPEDNAVNLVFFWGPGTNCTGVLINLACTSQETENLDEVSADFWHEARLELRRRFGSDLFVLAQCAPSGDLSPHPIYRQRAETAMEQRRGLTRRQEIARRIANAVDDGLPVARTHARDKLVFRHTVAEVNVPAHEPSVKPFYETDPVDPAVLHVLRLGEVAMATSPFELFVDYGTRITARSPAILTLLVQTAGAHSGYLPTARAVKAGGYSADKFLVGPEGGQVLVNETVKELKALFR